MVIKYWNIFKRAPEGTKNGFVFTITLPREFAISKKKRITFLGFNAIQSIMDCNYILIADGITNNDNLYSTGNLTKGGIGPNIGYSIIGCSAYYPHPKTFHVNDEIEEITFHITGFTDMDGNAFLIETKLEYEF